MSDFEPALQNAITSVYEKCILNGCWFHYKQAVCRKCRSMRNNFFKKIVADNSARKVYERIMSLPLLPSKMIADGFNQLKECARNPNSMSLLEPLFGYFEKNWLPRVFCPHIILKTLFSHSLLFT